MTVPRTEAELSEAIRSAQGPLCIRGGGTRISAIPGEPLESGGFSGVSLYEPGALTIVAGAGTPLAEVAATLAEHGQRLPFEPPDMRALLGTTGTPTIGGAVATNASGPRRIQAGALRDSLIGVRFVDGTSAVVKNGGRVMKNVTGYDLVKLMAGSYGTLGVLSEVAFKVLPAPDVLATLVIHSQTADSAVQAMACALASPFEVNAAAHDPATGETCLRIEGFEGSIAHRTRELTARLGRFGDITVENDPARWANIRDVAPFHGQSGNVWRISVKPSDAPRVLGKINAKRTLLDWGGGLIWALTDPGSDVRAALAPTQGHATLIRAEPETPFPRFHPEPPALAKIAEGLRDRFDPRGILNPGLMG